MTSPKPPKGERWEDILWQEHRYNERTVLKSGSYLRSFCPHCGQELMKDQMVHLETTTDDGREGWVQLSPYLNVFERRSDIRLGEGQEVTDLRCWHCHHSLRVEGEQCGRGDSRVASIMVGISSIRVPLYFCMREGCRWHRIDPDDEHKMILDDSMEW